MGSPTGTTATSTPDLASLRARLAEIGQDHVLNFIDRLDEMRRRALLDQICAIDLAGLPLLVDEYVKKKPGFVLAPDLAPAPFYAYDHRAGRGWDRAAYKKAGETLISAGKVAAFVVAGGQGSRLGYEGPKGCFPGGAVSRKPLFAIFAEGLLATERRYGKAIPWYIMTSPLNHEATLAFFKGNHYFGLRPQDVMFFAQGVMPSLDIRDGRMLMASTSEIATNPDGHGGSLKALAVSGALGDMKNRGVEHLSYFQVDNPLVRVVDPVFIGLHATAPNSSGEMSSKMIPKAYPEEKLGVFCNANKKLDVIEYSDLPVDLSKERGTDGRLKYLAGSIAIHVIGVSFIEKLNHDPAFSLPYHRAEKKIACIDPATGNAITPSSNNGVKLERFVFDALAFASKPIVYETDRIEEFAPIKNATGVDSVESCTQLQTARAASWLESAGVKVARKPDGTPDCVLELSPLTALEPGELVGKHLPKVIEAGARLAL